MTLKADRFIERNRRAYVVYCGVEANSVTYRLSDGSVWAFSRREAREIGSPRWAHLGLVA